MSDALGAASSSSPPRGDDRRDRDDGHDDEHDGDDQGRLVAGVTRAPIVEGVVPSPAAGNDTSEKTMMVMNPASAMKASVTNPNSRNQMSAHAGPTAEHAPPSSDGFHSSR